MTFSLQHCCTDLMFGAYVHVALRGLPSHTFANCASSLVPIDDVLPHHDD